MANNMPNNMPNAGTSASGSDMKEFFIQHGVKGYSPRRHFGCDSHYSFPGFQEQG